MEVKCFNKTIFEEFLETILTPCKNSAGSIFKIKNISNDTGLGTQESKKDTNLKISEYIREITRELSDKQNK